MGYFSLIFFCPGGLLLFYKKQYNPENLYDDPGKWGLEGRKIWLSRGIVIPGFRQERVSYIKIRRPLPGDVLGKHIGEWAERDGNTEIKFGGPRGGRSVMFRLEFTDHFPVLILTEGEWDAMLLWEHCADLCDMGTIGGAQAKFSALDLSLLTRYLAILVIHDDDKAGVKGREYIAELQKISDRIIPVLPPAHDLTEYWKAGGDLRGWIAEQVLRSLENALWQQEQIKPGRAEKILANIQAELLQTKPN